MHIVETITQSRPCVCMCGHRITVRTYAKETASGVFYTGHMRGTTPTPPVPSNKSIAEWEAENTTPKFKAVKIVRQANRNRVEHEVLEQNENYALIRVTEFMDGVPARRTMKLFNKITLSIDEYTPMFTEYLIAEYFR